MPENSSCSSCLIGFSPPVEAVAAAYRASRDSTVQQQVNNAWGIASTSQTADSYVLHGYQGVQPKLLPMYLSIIIHCQLLPLLPSLVLLLDITPQVPCCDSIVQSLLSRSCCLSTQLLSEHPMLRFTAAPQPQLLLHQLPFSRPTATLRAFSSALHTHLIYPCC